MNTVNRLALSVIIVVAVGSFSITSCDTALEKEFVLLLSCGEADVDADPLYYAQQIAERLEREGVVLKSLDTNECGYLLIRGKDTARIDEVLTDLLDSCKSFYRFE